MNADPKIRRAFAFERSTAAPNTAREAHAVLAECRRDYRSRLQSITDHPPSPRLLRKFLRAGDLSGRAVTATDQRSLVTDDVSHSLTASAPVWGEPWGSVQNAV